MSAQSNTARAQGSITDSVHTVRGVTVMGKHVPSSVSASTPSQSLTHAQMQSLGVNDVGEALKHFAGVQVRDYAGIGGLKTVNVRGLGSQHTGVVYDGVQVGDCQNGQVDMSRFALENVSLLSLVIGQGDDIYQSAKSYSSAAVIEIRSAFADGLSNSKPSLGVAFKTGSYGLANPMLLYSQKSGRASWNAYADYMRADGNYRFKLWNGSHLINEKRNNSDIETWRGEANASFILGSHQTLSWKLYGFESHRGLPGSVVYDNTYAAERLVDKNVFTQLQYENVFSDRIKMKAAAKWNYSWNRYSDVTSSGYTEDIYRQNETYLTATLWTEPFRNLHVSLAQDYAHNYLSMTIPGCPYPARESFWTALAANYIGLKNIVLNASLLYTNIHEHVKTGQASDGFHRLSPAFSLQWHLLEPLRLRLSYKDIFRTPTLNDLYYTGIGRRTLRPEKTKQWNVGATYSLSHSSGRWLALTADGYYGRVTDKIVAVPRMFLWSMMNVGKVRMLGVDTTVSGGMPLGEKFSADISATYNYLNATDRTDKTEMLYGDQIAYTPRHSGSGSVTLHSPWADLTYNLLVTSARYSLGYNIPENRMAGYADHSVSLYRTFHVKSSQLRVQIDALNLGAKNYEVVRFYPMPGRNFKLTVSYKFN